MRAPLEVSIEPGSARFRPDDDRWLRQVSDFVRELSRSEVEVIRSTRVVPGAKGSVESILMAVGSAGALTAAVEVFKAWLGRDPTRSIKLEFQHDGSVQSVELSGKGVNDGSLRRILRTAEDLRTGK